MTQQHLSVRFTGVFATAAGLFGLTALLAFLVAQRVGFNALEILWDPWQLPRLGLIQALLILPFFCAATAICLSFTRFPDDIPAFTPRISWAPRPVVWAASVCCW